VSIMPIRPIGCRCMAQDDPAWHNKECWIRQTDALRQQLATATYRLNVLEPEYTACQARAAAAERARYGLENAAARYGQQIVDLEQQMDELPKHSVAYQQRITALEQQLAQVIVERDAAETRNENYRLKLHASDSVIAQLSEHLAEDQAEITRLQEKP